LGRNGGSILKQTFCLKTECLFFRCKFSGVALSPYAVRVYVKKSRARRRKSFGGKGLRQAPQKSVDSLDILSEDLRQFDRQSVFYESLARRYI